MRTAEVSVDELLQRINELPRKRLAALPTACEDLPRLAGHLGVHRFFIKRDDLTGLGLGGNKSRALDFIVGDAVAQGCDVLVAGGGVEQSNHARQCAAAAARVGMEAVIVLQRRRQGFRSNGNLLVTQLLNARIEWLDNDPELRDRAAGQRRMRELEAELRAAGRQPYVLVSSVHPLGVVAYVEAAAELAGQLPRLRTRVYVTSEGAALGGLVLGSRALGLGWDVVGVPWRPTQPGTKERLAVQIAEAARLLGLPCKVAASDLRILAGSGTPYGEGFPASWGALDIVARLEGLLLDPVYTARGMAGVFAELGAGSGGLDQVVFVHTGGQPALFAYERDLQEHVLTPRKNAGVDGVFEGTGEQP